MLTICIKLAVCMSLSGELVARGFKIIGYGIIISLR